MAADAKLKSRIATLKSLNSIFSAMQVITVARLSKIKAAQKAAASFRSEIEGAAAGFEVEEEKKRGDASLAAVVVSGNRGLCGTFNQDINFRIQSFLKEHAGKNIRFFAFGRKGFEFLTGKKREVEEYLYSDAYQMNDIKRVSKKLLGLYRSGGISGIYVVYNHFISAFSRKATANQLLPFNIKKSGQAAAQVLIEPDRETFFINLTRLYIEGMLAAAIKESQLGEFSSRMVTLKSAIDNSKDLIGNLTVLRNKARQQMITQEILEIVEASEAMKGEE